MSPGKSSLKPVTPESVKILMILELGINAFFVYWIYSEYLYNVYFRIYVDRMLLANITTYTAALGLGIGLAGSAIAATLYHNLKHAKIRLENLANTKLKPSVQKIIAAIPLIEQHPQIAATTAQSVAQPVLVTNVPAQESTVVAALPMLPVKQEDKSSN